MGKHIQNSQLKTLNGESLIGSENIQINVPTKVSDLSNDADYITDTELNSSLSSKQDKLIAGDNITIIGNTISSVGGEVDLSEYDKIVDVNAKLDLKADKASTYTKQEVNDLIPDISDLATKSELTSGLSTKADTTYVNTELNKKANTIDVYNKTDIDSTFDDINSDISDLQTNKADKSNTYTKSETDALIPNVSTFITDAPEDGKTYGRKDKLWEEISVGGDSPLLKKGTGSTTSYYLDSAVEPTKTGVLDLRINGVNALGRNAIAICGASANTNVATGEFSTVIGGYLNQQATGIFSTVIGGTGNKAIGSRTITLGGESNTAFNYSENVVGMYSTEGTAQTARIDGSPIFRVGIGSNNSNRKDGFIVTNDGQASLPHLELDMITDDKQLVTKEYIDNKFWFGTQSEYDLITTPDPNILYFIKE